MPRLIDADALIKVSKIMIDIEWNHNVAPLSWAEAEQKFIDRLEDAPTIDPEDLRPKGRWEMRGGKLYCTHCGKRAAVARDSEDFWYTKGTPACPHCGAKMI